MLEFVIQLATLIICVLGLIFALVVMICIFINEAKETTEKRKYKKLCKRVKKQREEV